MDYTDFDLARDYDEIFDACLEDLRMDATVGHCNMRFYGSTVETALGVYFDENMRKCYDPTKLNYLRESVKERLNNPHGADDIKVFIKPEPHKLSKIETGRYRLISAVSLVDTMCDRIMFRRLAEKILSKVWYTPVMIGYAPVRGGHYFLASRFSAAKTRGLDKTAWDWTCSAWILKAVKEVIKELCLGAPEDWNQWLDCRWETLFRTAIFQFSDGTRVAQPGWGVMKSGCYLTAVINSIAQILHHRLACQFVPQAASAVFVVIGDDETIEDFPDFDEYERVILANGALLKPSEPKEQLEFAGWCYKDFKVWPEYWQKHLYQLTHKPLDSVKESIESYLVIYADEPNFGEWVRKIGAQRWPEKVRSRLACKNILNY